MLMYEQFIYIRNIVIRFGYKYFAKPAFFNQDPEDIHESKTKAAVFFGKHASTRLLTRMAFDYKNPMLEQSILNMKFINPIGLGAGFDKNAQLTNIMPDIGFGFEEIGSVTGEPCDGNPRPRLWRLKESKAIVVWYGLKNDGAIAISKKMRTIQLRFPVGISIAKTNNQTTCDDKVGIADYAKAFTRFTKIGDYFTINISCPNAFGGQPFTNQKRLHNLLKTLDKISTKKPIFIKLSPDLDDKNLYEILDLLSKHRIHGIICGNLTKNRNNPNIKEKNVPKNGGISGKVVEQLSNNMIRKVYPYTGGKYVIIGCGGVFSAQDAYTKIRLGSSLIQLITGMIYQGPQSISEINQGLVKLLKKDGFNNISEAIGVDN